MRKGWVLEQIVHGEQHHVAHFLAHPIVIAFAREEPAQALFADVGFDRQREAPFAREGKRTRVEVRGKHLQRRPDRMAPGFFEQQYGE